MLFTTVAALLFPVAIMAVPAQKPASGDDLCSPVSYILSEYTITHNSDYTFISFNIQSSYTVDSRANDPIKDGANCEADGAVIPNSNECNIKGKETDDLVFGLRKGSTDASYRIQHEWKCNDATWTSTNDITLPPLSCDAVEDGKNGDTVRCTVKPVIFTPQNVHKLSEDDLKKKVASKVKADAKPTAQPSS
ncbi:hypothetical protein BU25DRAFT_98499 [Macroventuria anomochaeta]|uniref:Uncharacterized protein n=1 Tax=Macroventuria anomochaeta TaxID=301207 RepID=A0ACB6RZ55_9PLEO|nr:uncharacterized protein BU25DRAFT_98499 [Macroventuria anomochaeta]KAF2626438.1 hypothetical protein BU25DRAFT_98499 [Macroventuria anomochaeta]